MRKALRLFVFNFRRELGAVFGWIGLLTAYNLLNIYLFRVYGDQSSIAEVYRVLPPVWRNMFGDYFITVNSLEGWLATQYFSFLPILLSIGLITLSSSLFSREAEDTSIHNILVQPVGRLCVFAANTMVPAAALVSFFLINVPVTVIASRAAGFPVAAAGDVVRLYIAAFAFGVFLHGCGIAVSVFVDVQKKSAGVYLGSVLILFVFSALLRTLDAAPAVRKLNPFYYYDCSRILREQAVPATGVIYWIAGGVAAISSAAWRFSGRDFLG